MNALRKKKRWSNVREVWFQYEMKTFLFLLYIQKWGKKKNTIDRPCMHPTWIISGEHQYESVDNFYKHTIKKQKQKGLIIRRARAPHSAIRHESFQIPDPLFLILEIAILVW